MFTLNKILSDCQNAVGDISSERLTPVEWVDIINSISKEIARETRTWIKRYEAQPNEDGTVDTSEVVLAPARQVHKLIKVMRGDGTNWEPYVEYSAQAISNSLTGITSFGINDIIIKKGFSTKLVSATDEVDETLTLVFATKFDTGEYVAIDYITFNPMTSDFQSWNPNSTQVELPDWMENSLRYGILARVYEKLYQRGDNSALDRMRNAEEKYNGGVVMNFNGGYLRVASAYARNLKDNYSKIKIQPLKYLGE